NASASQYSLTTDLSYKNFFANFDLFSGLDPTEGFVSYQPLASAVNSSLVGYLGQNVFLGVDYQNKDPAGRMSVRAESNKTFGQGLLIADLAHMPGSICGSWPAFWALGVGEDGKAMWPQAGEIDILEGVNDGMTNSVTLHTGEGCAVDNATSPLGPNQANTADAQMAFSGNMKTGDCNIAAANQDKNVGCSIAAPETVDGKQLPTYGDAFNKAGGGVYAMEWSSSGISVWFFASNTTASSIDLKEHPDTSTFGTPIARFSGSGCDFDTKFSNMKIIFNIAFCGQWAGDEKVWGQSCAKKTGVAKCADYVRDHPEAFAESYWEIRGLRWFEKAKG
ncbi:concanavalin A-like lectin/glucanase domain-containing protein, partial [Lophiotrema nucula]